MSERRRLPRNRTYFGGSIAFNNRYSAQDCTIKNMSADGAMLTFASTASIPEVFDLTIAQKSRSYIGKVIWREPERMGIMFLNSKLETPIPLDLVRRLKACEAEKEALKQRIARLSEPA
ncbi:PilZ domain-containing protein [Rhizobiales bacterium GAS191]|jgi:hypothetical protein|nr:PilZ domain-containing protein [Rhizobiales bacterium GAS191]